MMTSPRILLDGTSRPRDEVLVNAARAASGLHACGVSEGDTIALLLRNDFAFVEATQAAAFIGAYCVPINWHGKAHEIGHILGDARPKILVVHADLLAAIRSDLSGHLDDILVLSVPTPPELAAKFSVSPEVG